MSILIKGMEMPTSCYQCGFLFHPERHGKVYCIAVEPMMDISETLSDERASDCPLVPVPPHGRLIDADALIAKLNMMIAMAFGEGNTAFHFAYRSLGKVVENAPTIIEAEEGET